jgi:hypothetical protein
MIFKNKLKNKLANENELILWHGTRSNVVKSISRHGFNRSYAGINGRNKFKISDLARFFYN